VPLEELLRDAFLSLGSGLRELLQLEWRKHPGGLAIATTNRIALLQVFAVLLRNAAESIQRQGKKRGTVRLDFAQTGIGPDRQVVVALQDDGAGIRPEHRDQLFVSGFTTKHQSASGPGLHWCANTLQAMKGGIVAESEGPGRGACFRVTLALQEES
jgi:C4-dicarboxylate-specific signal transduction histidine kinase